MIGIITTGSRGDVQPFVALALALNARGQEVTLVASENFRGFITGYGIPFLPITGNSEQIVRSPEALKLLKGGSVLSFFYHLQKMIDRHADQANQDMVEACRNFDHLVVSILPMPQVYSIAERYNKKCAVVLLSLPPIPTREFPFQALNIKGHPWINKLSYGMMNVGYAMIRKSVNRFRKQIGLPPANVMKASLGSDTLALVALSSKLLKRPEDWPVTAQIPGFFYLPPAARTEPIPERLEDWLSDRDKPVYIGFGSIPVPDPQKFYPILEGLLSDTSVVLCTGWSTLPELPTHPNLFVTQYLNHDWILPQCRAAVIHGGIGTVGAVMKSGIPLIIVSILADQPVNGKLIQQQGLGVHIPFKKLDIQKLTKALVQVQTPEIQENCKAMAQFIQAEKGAEKAAKIIEEYFG
jgi:sterol 3beta-glucosyltransferase